MEWLELNWAEIGIAIGALIFIFDRVARLTPTKSDDQFVNGLRKLASVLSIRVPDVEEIKRPLQPFTGEEKK
jgi:phenylalanine-4-hydroxylase